MNVTYHNGKAEKKYQGCLGKMVNLFELNIGVPPNKRITDKPHKDGFGSSRRISSDPSSTTICDDRVEEENEAKSDRKSLVKPVKMLMDQEMSKEVRHKHSPPNLVAKLMGLDPLPPQENPNRAHARSRSVIPVSHYEQDGGFCGHVDDEKMALVRRKFAEAKLLSMDEKHRNSKKLQDALDVLNTNKDLFLKCLQEPSPLNHGDAQYAVPPTERKRITVLRPSKLPEEDKSWRQMGDGDNSSQPKRIVVLKPKSRIGEGFTGDIEDKDDDAERCQVREVAKAITVRVRDKLRRCHGDEEAMDSSLFSKGYAGDDSSFNKSEFEYSEAASPVSRHSWDCVNRAPYSPSALSRASYSSESSVSREAKKRLSERWALMSTTANDDPRELRTFRRSSSTLGEMLSLSEVKKAASSKSGGESFGEECDKDSDNPVLVDESETPRNLVRSKSLPVSSVPKEEAKTGSSKSSWRVKISNLLLFSRSRKTGEEKSPGSVIKVETQPVSGEKPPTSLQESSSAVASLSDHIGKKDVTGSEDQPSPVSVLDAPFAKDDHHPHHTPKLLPRCELPDKHDLKSIDKSPPIGSIARTLSWEDLSTGKSYPLSTSIQESEAEKREYIGYIETLLSGHKGPLDPSLRDKYVDPMGNEVISEAKRRQKRSIQKLMFDYVNNELIEEDNNKGNLLDKVRARVNEWFCEKMLSLSGNYGDDDCIMVVEGVVREEVTGKGWTDGLRQETADLGEEIEGEVMEGLVREIALEVIAG